MSQPHFFYDSAVSGGFASTGWVYLPFNFYARSMIIVAPYNTNTDDIFFSWDGVNVAGRVQVSAYAINLQNATRNGIYIKANSGTQGGMITAY